MSLTPAFQPHIVVPDQYVRRCAVTNCDGSDWRLERHHWAPAALFGKDSDYYWPTSYLCKKHHSEWHRVTATKAVAKARREAGSQKEGIL